MLTTDNNFDAGIDTINKTVFKFKASIINIFI